MKQKRCVGIIAEYNPFHNGHRYHLEESKKQTGAEIAVAVMSGSFTQRGELAMTDKWSRAEMAVRNGVDLVVELPVVFGANSAGYFARAGVEILEGLKADWISFGSETGDMASLIALADKISSHEDRVQEAVKSSVKDGKSYPAARQAALSSFLTDAENDLLGKPNTILALEYLRAMKEAQPVCIQRKGPGYNEEGQAAGFASASWIRHEISKGKDVSVLLTEETFAILHELGEDPFALADRMEAADRNLFQMAAQKILTCTAEELEQVASGGEGLGNKAKKELRYCSNLEELIARLKSKRYTRTRISRFIAQMLLGITEEMVDQAAPYVRVLAFNERGSRYLKLIKKEGCRLPVITNINKDAQNHPEIQNTLAKDVLASDLYNLAMGKSLYENSDYVRQPMRIV